MNPINVNIHPQGLSLPVGENKLQIGNESIKSFKDTLNEFVGSVNGLQEQAGAAEKSFLAGETSDIHQVMIAIEEASVAFEMLMEIRNKLLESYQQIMRLPM